MILVLLYFYIFEDDILEILSPIIKRIERRINIIKKNQKFKEKKDEQKRLYEKKKAEIKQNTEKRIKEMTLIKEEKIKKIEEKYDKLYKELDAITDQKQFLLFFNKFMNTEK